MQQHSYMGVESVFSHLSVDPGDQKQVIIFVFPASSPTEPSQQPFKLFLTIDFHILLMPWKTILFYILIVVSTMYSLRIYGGVLCHGEIDSQVL